MKPILKASCLISFFLLLFLDSSFAAQLAFPGAEGYGRYTTGGRGGNVYEVTNLNDSGTGSLRDAVSKSGARTIVFRVSGTIQLSSSLKIENGDLTIAGQTAPGDGICIAGYNVEILADNVIVRFLRFRLGNQNVANCECDAFGGRNRKNMIIDHCSMSWSIDEVGSFYDNTNMTLQWCIMSESLYNSGHVKGRHGYAGIQGGKGATFHHNLYANNTSRNPRINGGRFNLTTADLDLTDFRNNVIFNWGYYSIYGGEYGHTNIVNNYFKAGPATKSGASRYMIARLDRGTYTDPGEWYIAGNTVYGNATVSANNWSGGVQGPDATTDTAKVSTPFTFYINRTQTANNAYEDVLAYAGACYPKRDAVDARIVNEAKTGICLYSDTSYTSYSGIKGVTGIIDSQNTVGAWPTLNTLTALIDTDADGMPDVWELANGLDPNSSADRNTLNANGYTMLEVYLNSLVDSVMGYKIKISDDGNGSESIDNTLDYYLKGDVVSVTASPKSGYVFSAWTGDIVSTANPLTVTMDSTVNIVANYTLSAGLSETNSLKCTVYPTLVESELHISNLQISEAQLVLTDVFGKVILNKTMHVENNKLQLNLESLKTGIYFCTIISDSGARNSVKLLKK